MLNFLKKPDPDTSHLEFWQGSHYPEQLYGTDRARLRPTMTQEFCAEIRWMNKHNLSGRVVSADSDFLEVDYKENNKTFQITVMRGLNGTTYIRLDDTSEKRDKPLYRTVVCWSSGMKQKAFDRQVVAALDTAWERMQALSR